MEIWITLFVGLFGPAFGWWLAHRYSRRLPKDALDEDILVKVNDDMRKVFVALKEHYRSGRRIILDSGSEFLIDKVIEIRDATVKLDYILVAPGRRERYGSGTAIFRLSAIAFIDDDVGKSP